MTDQSAPEPTMEEILASIRRIISEDDAPAEPEPQPEPEVADDDVLELTELYEAPASETIGDLDIVEAAPEPVVSAPEPAETPAPAYDALVGESAAASAASAFAGLAASFKKPAAAPSTGSDMPFVSGNTVEAMVAEMLRPMLKDWLDNNLPAIVEAAVQREVERIARSA